MDRTARLFRIDQLLQERQVVPIATFLEELQTSTATFMRDLEYLRDRLNAPIVWDAARRGYHYEKMQEMAGPRFELPGLWFNASEIHAILTMEHLLISLQPSLLAPHIAPLRTRLRMLLDSGGHSVDEVVARIRVLPSGGRKMEQPLFETVANALLSRKVLRIHHLNRGRGEFLERDVSPQRLVFYRDNWYLDGWCHLRDEIRSFGLDAIQKASITSKPAREVSDQELDRNLKVGYGIFGGADTETAVIRFSPERSRWVANESWHPEQKGKYDAEGRWVLSFPYSNDTELVMDILRYGPDAEVLEPLALRKKVQERLREALARYG
ncbi:MAG: YafY family transcriptional regulator [Magnetococcales bacterium]|nr:YafY family transcriptional regulator [Magnetococcales bacterium]